MTATAATLDHERPTPSRARRTLGLSTPAALRQTLPVILQHPLPRLRRLDPATMALKQRHAQLMLQLGDLSTDRGRRHIQEIRCRTHAPESCRLMEMTDTSILHQTHHAPSIALKATLK